MMRYQMLTQDVTWEDYVTQDLANGASWEKLEVNEELDIHLSVLSRKRYLRVPIDYERFLAILYLDFSSVHPKLIETSGETSDIRLGRIPEELLPSIATEDYVVKMPPVKKYTIKLKIKGVKKAVPRAVVPEVP